MIERVLGPECELNDSWDTAGDGGARWRASVADLKERLAPGWVDPSRPAGEPRPRF